MRGARSPGHRRLRRRGKEVRLDAVGGHAHLLACEAAALDEPVGDLLGDGDHEVSLRRQPVVEGPADPPHAIAQHDRERIAGQLGLEQGVRVVDERHPGGSCQQRHDQALVVVGVDQVEALAPQATADLVREQPVEPEQLPGGRAGPEETVPGQAGGAAHLHRADGRAVTERVGEDDDPMAAGGQGLAQPLHADGRAAARREGAGGDDGDPQPAVHRASGSSGPGRPAGARFCPRRQRGRAMPSPADPWPSSPRPPAWPRRPPWGRGPGSGAGRASR